MDTGISQYTNELQRVVRLLDQELFQTVLNELFDALKFHKTIYLLGNGINNTTATHFANDLIKNVGWYIANKLKIGLKVIPLSDNVPVLTAFSNDIDFASVYAEYLRNQANSGDLLVIFSSSVPHENLVTAAKFARERGVKVISITGSTPGLLTKYSEILLSIKAKSNSQSEAIHMFLCHSWSVMLKHSFKLPVVFLDRDGVINFKRSDHVTSWDNFAFLPKVAEAIKKLNNKGYAVVVITNQAAVGRGLLTENMLCEIHENMCNSLLKMGALINKIYYCPHRPEENCDCRKPRPGLIKRAFTELPLDPTNAFMIGDSISDIEAAKACGISTILVSSTNNLLFNNAIPDYIVKSLPEAVDVVLERANQSEISLFA